MRVVDLTYPITALTPTFPGDPKVEFSQIHEIEKAGYSGFEIKMPMHVGTHIDAPAHMIKGGSFLSQFDAGSFCGRGHLADARGRKNIGPEVLVGLDINPGDIVLIMTGWYKKFGQKEYFENFPEISEKLAKDLIACGVNMVGMDTPSPDKEPYLIHKLFLKNKILILENLTNLAELIDERFEVFALPAKFHTEAAPARVVARIEKNHE